MRVQFRFGAAILAAALLGVGASPLVAQKSADTLRISMRDALPNVDPYYNNLRTGVVMHHQAWDTLVYRNPDTFKIEPLLATEWKTPNPTTNATPIACSPPGPTLSIASGKSPSNAAPISAPVAKLTK